MVEVDTGTNVAMRLPSGQMSGSQTYWCHQEAQPLRNRRSASYFWVPLQRGH